MPVIKVTRMAYGRLRAPDRDRMEKFLVDFGLVRAARTEKASYFRGTDPAHHVHVIEQGEPRLVGFAYEAASEDDLRRIAAVPGASPIESIDEPGGGKRVRLTEPNGYQIEIVHGIASMGPLPIERYPQQTDDDLLRPPPGMRVKFGPSRVRRAAHGVMATPRVGETAAWFRDHLGLVCSDDLYMGSQDNLIGSFNRIDAGNEGVDHHVLFCIKNATAGLHHLSFEVEDAEDMFIGHEHLKRAEKYEHMRGIGRHILGSQIYDYWLDPWGRMHEHWTSTERFDASSGSNLMAVGEGFTSRFGDAPSKRFVDHVTP
jgi:hypothetical protein